MSDNKSKRGAADRRKIDKNDPGEVGHAARSLETSPAKIHEAIGKVGPERKKVAEYVRESQKKK